MRTAYDFITAVKKDEIMKDFQKPASVANLKKVLVQYIVKLFIGSLSTSGNIWLGVFVVPYRRPDESLPAITSCIVLWNGLMKSSRLIVKVLIDSFSTDTFDRFSSITPTAMPLHTIRHPAAYCVIPLTVTSSAIAN
jgi:hypothetical protein